MHPPHFAGASYESVRGPSGGLQSPNGCLISPETALAMLAACGSHRQFATWIAGCALAVTTGKAPSQSAVARASGVDRESCRRDLAELVKRGLARSAQVGYRGEQQYEFSTGFQHAEMTCCRGSRSLPENLSTCGPSSRSHYPLNSEFKEREEELTQQAPDLVAAAVQELISVPDWLKKCRGEKKLRNTEALVRSYCARWPLATIHHWVRISEHPDLENPPTNRAAWIYDMLREFGATRQPRSMDGHPIRWQEALLAGDYEEAVTWLRRRNGYRREERRRKEQAEHAAALTATMKQLREEVPEVGEALEALQARGRAL